MISTQEFYDQTVAHMFTMSGPSVGRVSTLTDEGEGCVYRSDGDNTRCAVGYWITDKHYNQFLEGKRVNDPRVKIALFNSLGFTDPDDKEQMKRFKKIVKVASHLQEVHDAIPTGRATEEKIVPQTVKVTPFGEKDATKEKLVSHNVVKFTPKWKVWLDEECRKVANLHKLSDAVVDAFMETNAQRTENSNEQQQHRGAESIPAPRNVGV